MMGLPPELSGAHDPDFYIGVLRKILDADIPYSLGLLQGRLRYHAAFGCPRDDRQARALLGEEAHIVFHSHESAGISISST